MTPQRDRAGDTGVDPIPHSRPALGEDEKAAVAAVIASGQIAQGPEVAALEQAMASLLSTDDDPLPASHAVALSSGTAALLAALRSLGVGDGDEVLIPAYACASLNQAVVWAGATPRYIDCDPATLNPDPEDARRKLGPRTAACVVAHLFGLPADAPAFRDLGPPLIEDCAQTLGVARDGLPVGASGDVVVCSFYATKLIAGGEGGMLLARDAAVADRARALRDCEDRSGAADAFNFKLSDLHAALARVQLSRLGEFLARRAQLAADYRDTLSDAPVDLPRAHGGGAHAWFRFVVRLRQQEMDALLARCEHGGLACSRPVGRLVEGVDLDHLPGCREAWRRACSLPLYPALTDEEAAAVPRRFRAALQEPQ